MRSKQSQDIVIFKRRNSTPQQNGNITQNDENQDEDQIISNEEELDPVELIGTIRTFYDKDGRETMTECFL